MLDPATRTAKVRCTFANPEKELRPEMYATVEIAVDPVHALAVPRDAIVHLGETQLAFVQGSDERGSTHFMRVPVEVEEWGASPWLVVKRGLERGQSVVVNGASQLSQSL